MWTGNHFPYAFQLQGSSVVLSVYALQLQSQLPNILQILENIVWNTSSTLFFLHTSSTLSQYTRATTTWFIFVKCSHYFHPFFKWKTSSFTVLWIQVYCESSECTELSNSGHGWVRAGSGYLPLLSQLWLCVAPFWDHSLLAPTSRFWQMLGFWPIVPEVACHSTQFSPKAQSRLILVDSTIALSTKTPVFGLFYNSTFYFLHDSRD